MPHPLIYMLPLILAVQLNGFEVASPFSRTRTDALLSCNRNRMVSTFGSSEWVTLSDGERLVALTRAQTLCVIMEGSSWSCDCYWMSEIWCWPVWNVLAAEVMECAPERAFQNDWAADAAFLNSLRRPLLNARGVYPPVALAEIYIASYGQDTQMCRLVNCLNTLPVPLTELSTQGRCRFVYGKSTDGSDFPCFLLWPERSADD